MEEESEEESEEFEEPPVAIKQEVTSPVVRGNRELRGLQTTLFPSPANPKASTTGRPSKRVKTDPDVSESSANVPAAKKPKGQTSASKLKSEKDEPIVLQHDFKEPEQPVGERPAVSYFPFFYVYV